jgi:hypothetical protein
MPFLESLHENRGEMVMKFVASSSLEPPTQAVVQWQFCEVVQQFLPNDLGGVFG